MEIQELEWIVDAIDEESRQPSPSQQNLARLVAKFMRLLLKELRSEKLDVTPTTTTTIPAEPSEHNVTPKKIKRTK